MAPPVTGGGQSGNQPGPFASASLLGKADDAANGARSSSPSSTDSPLTRALTAPVANIFSRGQARSQSASPHELDAAAASINSAAGSPALQDGEPVVTIGILHKFIHLRGWRPRLFVLQGGILRYYKIHGETAVNTSELLKVLHEEAEVHIIGTEVSRQEAMSVRRPTRGGSVHGGNRLSVEIPQPNKPQGELHLQVVSLRTSNSDSRKFFMHSGVNQAALRAESRDDRRAWLNAIFSGKGQVMRSQSIREFSSPMLRAMSTAGNGSPAPGTRLSPADDVSSGFKATVEGLSERLRTAGVSRKLVEDVEQVLNVEHVRMCDLLGAETEKCRRLVGLLQQVEDQKRELETRVVMDVNHEIAERRRSKPIVSFLGDPSGAAPGDPGPSPEALQEEDEEEYELEDDRSSGTTNEEVSLRASLGLEDESSDDDEFYDCEHESAVVSRTSSSSSMSSSLAPAEAGIKPLTERRVSMTAITEASFLQGVAVPQRRTELPTPHEREKSVSLWSIIRDCIGKDLTRICLPVFFNEPVSALQKGAEDLEYSELLDQAAQVGAGTKRLLLVSAFAASSYSSTPGRTRKPFNPLLGETFELVMPEKGFRLLSEKVCHHPTILCSRCQGRGWLFEADGEVKSKFWGRYIELHPVGTMQVTFADGEVYTWHKVVTSINNLIIGKLYIDHGGVMRIVNQSTGMQAKIRFKETSMMDRNPRQIRGHLEDAQGQKVPGITIVGKWDEYISANSGPGDEVLWKVNPQAAANRYNMTKFSILLNEVVGSPSKYAPTDCRLRPDQRALEDGRYKDADREKLRLEQKQRKARKAAEEGKPLDSRWFEKVEGASLGENLAYRYRGGYFECKAKGEFSGCRDIFGE